MAKTKKKFAQVKKRISPKDSRLHPQIIKKKPIKNSTNETIRRIETPSSALFFAYNTSLGPPYRILLDTNFINFSIKNKLDVLPSAIDCLLSHCIIYITDCVMAELEKLGPKFRLALRIAKNDKFERLKCTHKGTYADDCLVRRVEMHKCYIVATCDRNLKRRIRKIAGVPIMFIKQKKYTIERLPEAYGAPK